MSTVMGCGTPDDAVRLAARWTGHGSPLPPLKHGGPGRASGGEELAGVHGVLHYMQRAAVQSGPAMLASITGRQGESS